MCVESKLVNPKKIFFDTNSLRELKFIEEIVPLLGACKDGIVSVYVCEPVLYERARQHYQADKNKHLMPTDYTLVEMIANFKELFVSNGAIILETTRDLNDSADELINEEDNYYKSSNKNDRRDALIFSMAMSLIDKDNTTILCREKKLGKEFEINGFNVERDAREFLKGILGDADGKSFTRPNVIRINSGNCGDAIRSDFFDFLKLGDPEYYELIEKELHLLPVVDDKLVEKLEEMKAYDIELLKRILGYSMWFSPIGKNNLIEMLGDEYEADLVSNMAERLCLDGLLVDTGSHYLANDKDKNSLEVCDQAMSSVMGEILEMVGAD